MQWYDLRQHALLSPYETMDYEAKFLRAYMRMLASNLRPDRPAQVFNGFRPETERQDSDA